MFDFISKLRKHKQKKDLAQQHLAFQERGIIDVTNYDAKTPEDPLGYMSSGIVQVSPDGKIIIYSESDGSLLENISLADIILGNDNINHYDPEFQTAVSLITKNKGIRIHFDTIELKREFWDSITAVYGNLKTE